jgi:probable HAF family extracellular repeat protein
MVAGVSSSSSGEHAFLWTRSSGMIDLGLLPGDSSSRATHVTQSGQVVGSSRNGANARAFLWTRSGGMQNLGTLPTGKFAEAHDMNNLGLIVGSSDTLLGWRAFIWTSADGIQDLNKLIPTSSDLVLTAAQSINDRGQIIAIGVPKHDQTRDRMVDMDDENHAGPSHVYLLYK